jgi:TolA-binding protein
MTRLTGRIEDLERNHQDDSAQKKLTELVQTLENRVTQLEQSQMAMLEEMKKKPGSSSSHQKPDALFEKGKEEFGAGKLEDAAETLSAYLESSDKKHVEDAIFMRGEAYYGLGEFKKAIVDYSKFPEKYRKSKKVPAALYKIGLSFDAMSMKDDAKAFYQEIVDKYEDSPEAKKAAKKLATKSSGASASKTGKKKPAKP